MLSGRMPVSRENCVNFCCSTALASAVRPAKHRMGCFNFHQILTHCTMLSHIVWLIQTYCKACWGPQTLRPLSWQCGPERSHRTQRQQRACRCHCSKLMKAEINRSDCWIFVCVCIFCVLVCALLTLAAEGEASRGVGFLCKVSHSPAGTVSAKREKKRTRSVYSCFFFL